MENKNLKLMLIESRINLLKARKNDNGSIVKKLERRRRSLLRGI